MYLGIDETGSVSSPQRYIYTAVWSDRPGDIQPHRYTKSRGTGDIGDNIQRYLHDREFAFMCVPEGYKDVFGHGTAYQLMIYATFIEQRPVSHVYIDGAYRPEIIDILEEIVLPQTPDIRARVKGDKRFGIVNKADRVAYQIGRHVLHDYQIDFNLAEHELFADVRRYEKKLVQAGFSLSYRL